jgi:hypothetical protein
MALCYTERGMNMNGETDRTLLRSRWESRLAVWQTRLHAWGLEGVVAALLEAAEPLGPLGAQALYVAQPTLGLFLSREAVGQWAHLLEDPANVAWLRDRLTRNSHDMRSPDEEGSPDGPGK